MKIKINKSKLENIIINFQPFLEKRDNSQITSHILIETQLNTLILKATDYEIGIITRNIKKQRLNSPQRNSASFLFTYKSQLIGQTLQPRHDSKSVRRKSRLLLQYLPTTFHGLRHTSQPIH